MTVERRFCHWTKGGKFIKARGDVGGLGKLPRRCGCLSCSPGELRKFAKFKADVELVVTSPDTIKPKNAVKIRRKMKQANVASSGRR